MTHDEMIAVIAAHRDGKALEWRYRRRDEPYNPWRDIPPPVVGGGFDFTTHEFRIKSSPPKPREWWIIEVCKGISQGFSHKSHAAEAVKTLNLCAGSEEYASLIHVIEVLPSSGKEP